MRSLQTTRNAAFKAALLAGGAGFIALAQPAYAQDNGTTVPTKEPVTSAPGPDQKPGDQVTDQNANPNTPGIVVTGSRIVRKDYEANSPTVTVDNTFLKQSGTAAIENQLNKLPQFVVSQSATTKNNEGGMVPAGGDIQPNSTNTPGAATVSLRGVGANRTLVLIDGRRGTPGNASGTVDISTIPSSAIERVEIVSGGASATYGADAVAGVTNFILRKNFQGLELDGQASISNYGDGFEYQISGIMGSDFADGRGNVTLAMSTNKRNQVNERDRPWYRDLWANPDYSGNTFFMSRPGVILTAQPTAAGSFFSPPCGTLPQGCVVTNAFPGANPPVPNESTNIFANYDGTLFTGNTYATRGGAVFFKPGGFSTDAHNQYSLTSAGVLKDVDTSGELQVPLTRYNFYARGNYEINDWIGVFGQGLFSHTHTFTKQQPGTITTGWDVQIPWGSGTYTGNIAVPSSVLANGNTNPAFKAMFPFLNCAGYTSGVGGCTNTEAFKQVVPTALQTVLNGRTNPNAPVNLFAEFPDPRTTATDVLTYNLVAGFEGSIPGSDWTWDLSVNHGISQTTSTATGIYSLSRTRAVVGSPNFGEGFSSTGNSLSNGFGASTGKCTTGFDFFNMLGNANTVSNDCRQAIRADLSNKGTMRQTIWEANAQGGLFELPAGQLRVAVGASYREQHYKFINDGLLEKDRSFLDQALGIYPAGDTDGTINTKEVYGELLVPLIHDTPFVKKLDLELGGRISDYNTTGTSYTFKALGDWEVNDWLRFRGGFNRAERAPNIAELFLSPQQNFGFDSVGDLCANYSGQTNVSSANPAANSGGAKGAADVQAVCMALMKRDNGGVAPPDNTRPGGGAPDGIPDYNFYNGFAFLQPFFGAPGGFAFPTVAGNSYYRQNIDPSAAALKPEIANTWTAGFVIQKPTDSGILSHLRMSVDYFNITINHPIGALSPGGMQQLCLDPAYNPSVTGAAGPDGIAGTADDVTAAAIAAGACQKVHRGTDAAGGTLNSAAMVSTYRNDGLVKLSGIDAQLDWSTDLGPGNLFLNVTGNYMFHFEAKELDPNPLIDYAGTTGTGIKGLNFGNAFRWRTFTTVGYTYKGASLSLQWQHTPKTRGYSQAPDLTPSVPNYDLFNLNGSYQLTDNLDLRFTVDNLFNRAPPVTGVDTNLSNNAAGTVPCTNGACGFSYFTDLLGRRFSVGANLKF